MMRLRSTEFRLAAMAITMLAGVSAAEAVRVKLGDWKTVQSDEYGFMIAYPGSVFETDQERSRDGGHVLVSRDGRATLLVATFENEGNASLEDYRQQLMMENYPDAELDFTPVRKNWFVLSGTQGDEHFYYRVNFTCGGRLINSWALIYPLAERRFYDNVVEAVAPTYTPGAGKSGECD